MVSELYSLTCLHVFLEHGHDVIPINIYIIDRRLYKTNRIDEGMIRMIQWIRSYLIDFTCLLAIGIAIYFITISQIAGQKFSCNYQIHFSN